LRAAEAFYGESLHNNAGRIQNNNSELAHDARSPQHDLFRRSLGFDPQVRGTDHNGAEV
jgi:hypothetical protein